MNVPVVSSPVVYAPVAEILPPLSKSEARPPAHPLGTAAWHEFKDRPDCRSGDLFLGRTPQGHPVGLGDDRHVLITCGTRGGKGVSTVIPNLCLWPGSVVVVDPKGENAMVTARRRANGNPRCEGLSQKVRILDPFDAVGTPQDSFGDLKVAYNPLDLIDPKGTEGIDTAARIADALISSDSAVDPFWEESARTLIKALILHVASGRDFKGEDRNLATVRRLMMAGDEAAHQLLALSTKKKIPSPLALLFAGMKRNRAFGGVVANAGEMFANMDRNAARTLTGIIQVAVTNTDFIDSPEMKRCLAKSDFSLSELKADPKGTSLYLSLPQRFMPVHFRWLRMMTTLVVTEMERVPHLPKCGHPVMTVLDEFPALRRMRSIENAAAQIAGFGVKMVFVAQTLAQLKDIYKDNWETFVANAGVRLFWNVEDHFTREYASKLVGECEVIRDTGSRSSTSGVTSTETTSQSWSRTIAGQATGSATTGDSKGESRSSSWSSTSGTSEAIHKRPLIAPDEIGRLFGNPERPALLALVSGHQPMSLKRVRYFDDPTFAGIFDGHKDHGWPPTLQQRQLAIAQEQRLREEMEAAERRRFAEAEARRQAEALAQAEQKRLIDERKRKGQMALDLLLRRQARRRAWVRGGLITGAVLIVGSGLMELGGWMLTPSKPPPFQTVQPRKVQAQIPKPQARPRPPERRRVVRPAERWYPVGPVYYPYPPPGRYWR